MDALENLDVDNSKSEGYNAPDNVQREPQEVWDWMWLTSSLCRTHLICCVRGVWLVSYRCGTFALCGLVLTVQRQR